MFVHAPEKSEITVSTLIVWDDADLAMHAVEMCRKIQSRLDGVEFQIEEADASDLESKGEAVRTVACDADMVVVALQRNLGDLPDSVRAWFLEWSQARKRQAGALAVLRPPNHVDGDQFRRMVHETKAPASSCPERERDFRKFIEDCAMRGNMELFWGSLESEIEEATRELRIFEAQDPSA